MAPCPCCAGPGEHVDERGNCGSTVHDEDPEFGVWVYACALCQGSGEVTEHLEAAWRAAEGVTS
jgi:hypothetical protein